MQMIERFLALAERLIAMANISERGALSVAVAHVYQHLEARG